MMKEVIKFVERNFSWKVILRSFFSTGVIGFIIISYVDAKTTYYLGTKTNYTIAFSLIFIISLVIFSWINKPYKELNATKKDNLWNKVMQDQNKMDILMSIYTNAGNPMSFNCLNSNVKFLYENYFIVIPTIEFRAPAERHGITEVMAPFILTEQCKEELDKAIKN